MNLVVKNLTKDYYQGETLVKALDAIDFESNANTLSIIGPSGSGKTTLLTLLSGLDSTTSGEIILGDQSITKLNEKEMTQFRAENIGIVFQQFHLMPHLSALENVMLPLEILGAKDSEERAIEFLDIVGLKERIHHLPSELSGGECQRVAIARATVTSPKYLFADEPSGNLDFTTGNKVMDLLFKLSEEKNMKLVLVTHDNELANRCDQQIHIIGGKLQ